MVLKPGTALERGKYRIDTVLGQGGFGITYLGEQIYLGRKVAIKEFFMDGVCVRDESTQAVTAPADNGKGMVERFRRKFIKEAQNIARLRHRGIVPIIDIFEENGTAYYVMEHLSGGSLSSKVHGGALPQETALRYIRQVAAALGYVHAQRMMHLDIKPANILIDDEDNAVLIDFGLSKKYDSAGQQTSTTPVGISHGYAPLEQYKQGGVEQFTPATDIYSLGATLYKLVTGATPPEASDVMNMGLPPFPPTVSPAVQNAITKAMQPAVKARPQSVAEFLALLGGEGQKPVPPVAKPVVKTPGPTVVTETAVNDAGSADNAGKGGGINVKTVIGISVSAILVALLLTLAAAGAGAYFFLLDGTDSDVKKPHIEHEYTVGNDSLIKLPSSIKFKKGGPVFKITWKDTVYELTYNTEGKKVVTVTLDGVKDLECMQIIGDFLSADTLKDGIAYKFTDKFKGSELFVKFDIEEKPRVYLFTINGAPAGKVAEKTGNTTAYMKVSDSSDDEPATLATVAKALRGASGGDKSYDAEYSLGYEEVTFFTIKYTGAGYGGGKIDAEFSQERSPFKGGNSAAVDCGWYTYKVNGIDCDVAVTNASVPTDNPYVRIPLEEGEYVVLLRINK